jgi:hypothetical protein
MEEKVIKNPTVIFISKVIGFRFKPALARFDMHSWHDRIECCARSFYALGEESQVWARGSKVIAC